MSDFDTIREHRCAVVKNASDGQPSIVVQDGLSEDQLAALARLETDNARLRDTLEEMLIAPVHDSHELTHLSKRLREAHQAARDLLAKSERTP